MNFIYSLIAVTTVIIVKPIYSQEEGGYLLQQVFNAGQLFKYEVVVKSAEGDKNYREVSRQVIEMQVESLTAHERVKINIFKISDTKFPLGEMTLSIDSKGEVNVISGDKQAIRWGELILTNLPVIKLKVGETYVEKGELPESLKAKGAYQRKTTLLGYESKNNYNCAKVIINYILNVEGEGEIMAVEKIVYFAYELGNFVVSSSSVRETKIPFYRKEKTNVGLLSLIQVDESDNSD